MNTAGSWKLIIPGLRKIDSIAWESLWATTLLKALQGTPYVDLGHELGRRPHHTVSLIDEAGCEVSVGGIMTSMDRSKSSKQRPCGASEVRCRWQRSRIVAFYIVPL